MGSAKLRRFLLSLAKFRSCLRQVSNPNDFVQLEPWAVPCGTDWMKQNENKWQGIGRTTFSSCFFLDM